MIIGADDDVPAGRDSLHRSEVLDELDLVLVLGQVQVLLEVEVVELTADGEQRPQLLLGRARVPEWLAPDRHGRDGARQPSRAATSQARDRTSTAACPGASIWQSQRKAIAFLEWVNDLCTVRPRSPTARPSA